MKAILFGLAAGAAFQAWRNYPPDGVITAGSAALLAGLAAVLAYLVGRGRRSSGGAVAVAVAEATATSTSAVNVAIFTGAAAADPGVTAVGSVVVPDLDAMPWTGDRKQLPTPGELVEYDLLEQEQEAPSN